MSRVFIIAEAGINHNGSITNAKRLIDVATAAGADAVKFQTFKAEKVISKFAPKAEYQKKTTNPKESQLDMAKKLELSNSEFKELFDYCKKTGIIFLSTPFDLESIDFLVKLGLDTIKIPSGEITNLLFLRKIAGLGKKVIMSTGMSDMKEIETALNILTESGTKKEDITVLHCNTDYPTKMEDVNLFAMITIRDAFKVKVGYSDHTLGIEIPIAAVALGAMVIEKHFTLDRNMDGPDHRASLIPAELKAMIKAIRNIEKAMGDGIKEASESESKIKPIARRSIVAARDIKKGDVFTEENITVKRPGTGISPMEWDKIIGTNAKKNFSRDEIIEL